MKSKSTLLKSGAAILMVTSLCLFMIRCSEPQKPAEDAAMSQEEIIARGEYIVHTGGCEDCHSPKVFGPMGPVPDSTKMLAGHQAGSPIMVPVDTNALRPGWGYIASADMTSWIGPWGISYTFNLTPDSATGIGAWTEENFVKALKTGKHLGLEGGRPILPPMPWQVIGLMTEDDLKAIYAYLRTIPAISNQVPAPVAPPDVVAMAANKP